MVASRAIHRPLAAVRRDAEAAPPTRGFSTALRKRQSRGQSGVIAEIKKASPSKGVIRQHFETSLSATNVLELLHGLVAARPCLSLRYGEAEEAVALLQEYVCAEPVPRDNLAPASAGMGAR